MKKRWVFPTIVLLALCMVLPVGSDAKRRMMMKQVQTVILTPDDIQWKEGPPAIPGSKMAVLDGNPKLKGFFVARMKLPAGTKIPPHMHDNVERVTIVSGTFNLAMGDKAENPKVLPAGSYFSLPPHTVHNAWVDEETVLQINTRGPWTFKPVK